MKVYVNMQGDVNMGVDCPFRSDVFSCPLVKGSQENYCPETYEDKETGLYFQKTPDTCPLRREKVIVEKTK